MNIFKEKERLNETLLNQNNSENNEYNIRDVDKDVDYYYNRDKEELCHEEGGFVPYAYLDTSKNHYATIGCGINLDTTDGVNLYDGKTSKSLSEGEYHKTCHLTNEDEYNFPVCRWYIR